MQDSEATATRQIARAAGLIMIAFGISNLTGLVRQILVANAFGTQVEIDAFNAANRVTETLFNLVAGGALASAFIPTFTSLLTQEQRKTAWRLASAVANLVFLISLGAAIIAAVYAPQVVRYVLAPGFATHPAQEALAVSLLRCMLPSTIIFALSGLAMGILNSHQVFLLPALTPSMYQLGMIFGVLVLSPRLGIYGLAWGVVIGASLHLFLQIPSLVKLKWQYFPTWGLDMPSLREVARLMGPRLLGVAVVQLNFWVNTRLASQMMVGSVAAVYVAFTLMLMPQAAIAQSIAIAAMPTFSRQIAMGRLDDMRASLAASLRGAILLAIPASAGLMILGRPLIVLLYQRGEFDARSTDLVSWALLWYAAGMVGHAIVEILSRAFYSLHDTKTPVFIGAGAMALNVVFSYLFAGFFASLGWMPHGGLALANSLATALESAGLVVMMQRRMGGLDGKHILSGTNRAILATLVMGIVLWAWLRLVGGHNPWLSAGVGVLLGGVTFGITVWFLKVEEVRGVTKWLIRRVGIRRYN